MRVFFPVAERNFLVCCEFFSARLREIFPFAESFVPAFFTEENSQYRGRKLAIGE